MSISVELALETLLGHVQVGNSIRLPLTECYGRVLAEDIISTAFPPFDRSPLDGYAVRMDDIRNATVDSPVLLEQIDYIPAGTCPMHEIKKGKAARIMTGGKMPDGADAVVRIEDTIMDGGYVVISNSYMADKHICYKGEEFGNGEIALSRGTVLNEGGLGILAMMGQATPLIYKKPQVGILATGSELAPISEPLQPGTIHNTNSYMLMSKVLASGGQPVLLGEAKDDTAVIAAALSNQPGLPIYITTGGASVGDYDLMGELFKQLGVKSLFNRVAMKPGMPVLAGIWNGSLLIALSGNPAACSVSFEILVKPLLKVIAGMNDWAHKRVRVKLASEFKKASSARRYVWARCCIDKGMAVAEPLWYQGNGMLKAAVTANALLEIPANSRPLELGTELEALLLS